MLSWFLCWQAVGSLLSSMASSQVWPPLLPVGVAQKNKPSTMLSSNIQSIDLLLIDFPAWGSWTMRHNRMAAQHLPRDLVRPSCGQQQLAQKTKTLSGFMKNRKDKLTFSSSSYKSSSWIWARYIQPSWPQKMRCSKQQFSATVQVSERCLIEWDSLLQQFVETWQKGLATLVRRLSAVA